MNRHLKMVMTAASLCVLLAACGGGNEASTPESVMDGAIKALSEGDYQAFRSLCHDNYLKENDELAEKESFEEAGREFKEVYTSHKVNHVEIDGDMANVEMTLTFEGGVTETESVTLKREGKKWLLYDD
jgi:hypothetical protein